MANVRISDLPSIAAGELSLSALIEVEISGGGSRKVTIAQFLAFLGIPVGTLAALGTPSAEDNLLAFGSDVVKVGESSSAGTGSLLMTVDQTGWDRVADAAAASI